MTEIVGYSAAALTTASFLPQLIKAWKTKETKSLSLSMLCLLILGLGLWLTYGILTQAYPVIAANGVTIVMVGVVLALKLRYG